MRGTDPNMRPLNTYNKMIIVQWWSLCPSPTLICQLIVMDYLFISYIYHVRVCLHVHLHVYLSDYQWGGLGGCDLR